NVHHDNLRVGPTECTPDTYEFANLADEALMSDRLRSQHDVNALHGERLRVAFVAGHQDAHPHSEPSKGLRAKDDLRLGPPDRGLKACPRARREPWWIENNVVLRGPAHHALIRGRRRSSRCA